jgi:hypothetical protein
MSGAVSPRNILVPVDFSVASEQALQHATALRHALVARSLLHVIESGRYVGDFTKSETAMTEIPRRVEERLRMFIGGSGKPALFDRVEARAGRPYEKRGNSNNSQPFARAGIAIRLRRRRFPMNMELDELLEQADQQAQSVCRKTWSPPISMSRSE